MLIDMPGIQIRLHGIVQRLAPPPLREDLVQESMVHLWRTEEQYPGRCEAWYLQSCRFHLQNFLRQGRSVDSHKRYGAQALNQDPADDEFQLFEPMETNETLVDEVSVNDFMAELSEWLAPAEKDTLRCLMDGLTARETARLLNVSHTLVNRHRSRIADLAVKLGITPPRRRPGPDPKEVMSTQQNNLLVSTPGKKTL
jgi:RNA polymerase sigma factor (sigma-70 family)